MRKIMAKVKDTIDLVGNLFKEIKDNKASANGDSPWPPIQPNRPSNYGAGKWKTAKSLDWLKTKETVGRAFKEAVDNRKKP